ncbi:MAG: polysaccharide deacetylase family protein [Chthoniobacterales bacterium]
MRQLTIWLKRDAVALPAGQALLTFDDGPNATEEITRRLLQTLADFGVRAAFCVCGCAVDECPSLTAEIHSSGHILVNHTHAHRVTDLFQAKALIHEIQRCDRAIGNALGVRDYRSRFFRPPGGLYMPSVNRVLKEMPLELMPLTFYAWDTCSDSANANRVIHHTVTAAIRDGGGVFVLHDGLLDCYPWTMNSVPIWRKGVDRTWIPGAVASIIDRVRKAGISFADPAQLPAPFVLRESG